MCAQGNGSESGYLRLKSVWGLHLQLGKIYRRPTALIHDAGIAQIWTDASFDDTGGNWLHGLGEGFKGWCIALPASGRGT